MYQNGDGTKIDVKRAIELYTLAAEQGLARAQHNLGCRYANGDGVEQSFTTAREWLTKAAAQGQEESIASLKQIDEHLKRTTTTSTDVKKSTSSNTTTQQDLRRTDDKKETSSTLNFTAGDRCLVHLLESEAGQLLNGQHVNLVDGIIRKGRLRCRFEDGTIRNVKLNNLKKIQVTTGDDDKKSTSSTTTPQQQQQQQEEEEEDECPICLEVLPRLSDKFLRNTCCGKGMHYACAKKKDTSKSMSYEQRSCCVLCRTKLPTEAGSKEAIKQLRFWVERGKGWALSGLGDLYSQGLGVPEDKKRALELYTMAAKLDYVDAIYNLGLMYLKGDGTEQDIPKAKELLMRAATLGHVDAIIALKRIDKHEGNTTPTFTPTRTSCSFCGVPHAPPKVKLNPCSGCHSVYYCCKEHQIKDWKLPGFNGHKAVCKKLQ